MFTIFLKSFTPLLILILLCSCTNSISESAETSAETASAEPDALVISGDIIEDLAIIRSDTCSESVTKAAVNVKKAVEEALGSTVKISTDWKKNPTYKYEIIVGSTLREETENFSIDKIELGEKGYTVRVSGNKIFIVGGSDTGSVKAAEYFIENIIKEGSFEIPFDYEYSKYQEYDIPVIQINGNDSKKYPIICSSADKKAAESLRDSIYSKSGVWHEIIENGDESTDNAIILSSAKPEADGIISVSVRGNSLLFENSSSMGLSGCVNLFLQKYIYKSFGGINFPAGFEFVDLGDYIIVNY